MRAFSGASGRVTEHELQPRLAVALTGVSRVYPSGSGEVIALDHVSLRVDAGEWLAVTGPSGSGKTTLLNLVAGLDRPSEGAVVVLGEPLIELSERELTAFRARHLGLVFQEPYLLPGLTALENVVVAQLPWWPRQQLIGEARELLAAVGLQHRVDFPPARLSGGERQRVGIARALLGQPELILADEPTGDLDAHTTAETVALLERLRDELGLTLMVATHDQIVAGAAGRVVRLAGGRLASNGSNQAESPED